MKKETSLYDLLSIVLCHIKSIIIVSVCAALATFGLTYTLSKPVYTYSGSLMIYTSISAEGTTSVTQAGQAFVLASYYVDTYVSLLQSNSFCAIIQDQASDSLAKNDIDNGSDKSFKELKKEYKKALSINTIKSMLSLSYEEDLLLFYLSCTSNDQALAKAVSNAAINNAPDFSKLYGEFCELKVVDNVSGSVSTSNPYAFAVIAFLIAAFIMMFIFVIYNSLDHKIKDETVLTEHFEDIPIIGMIPDFEDASIKSKGDK